MSDPRFLRVVLRGVGGALGLLIAIYLCLLAGIAWVVPGEITLPWLGPIHGLAWAAGIAGGLAMLGLSVFLMVPVASAFSALFLDEVAEAVELAYYPGPPGRALGLWAGLAEGAGLLGVMILVSALALALSFVLGPFGPVLFWGVNGWLLGREYFRMVALRHLPRDQVRALMRRHGGTIWLAGGLMAAPLSFPLVGLFVPVLGAATFTHLFQRVRQG